MVMPSVPTLKEVKDSIELKIGKVELDVVDLKAAVDALKEITERLEAITKTIQDKTDLLPEGFTRAGQYRAR